MQVEVSTKLWFVYLLLFPVYYRWIYILVLTADYTASVLVLVQLTLKGRVLVQMIMTVYYDFTAEYTTRVPLQV